MSSNIPQNSYNIQNTPQIQKRTESQENFTAIDKEKLKQDTAQFSKEAMNDNFAAKTIKNTKSNSTKKIAISLGLTLATVIGGAAVGNLSSDKMAKLGLKLDDFLLNNKTYQGISGFFKKGKNGLVTFLKKSKTISDIMETVKTRTAKAKANFARGYGQGFVNIFALTPVDVLKKSVAKSGKSADEVANSLTKLVGEEKAKKFAAELLETHLDDAVKPIMETCKNLSETEAKKLAQQILKEGKSDDVAAKLRKHLNVAENFSGNRKIKKFIKEVNNANKLNELTNRKFCQEFSDAISENFNCKNKKDLMAVFEQMKKGELGDDIINVDMVEKGPMGLVGSWWPVNIANSIGKKIKGDKWKGFCRGNLGDSLIKFNVVDGSMAKTAPAKLLQKSILVPTESITNFVNDKSGMGALLCLQILGLYNNVQDAPKGKKAATLADDFVGTMGSIAISTPIAYGATYGLASLRNLEGKTIFSKILKPFGNFFGMGLDKIAKDGTVIAGTKNPFIRFGGGLLRFAMIMALFTPKISKPIYGAIHKVFGKPYDKNEEIQKQQLEEQGKQIIPELGISQSELMEKVQKNPKAIEELQKNPQLAQKLSQNPKLLVDYLDGKDINNPQTPQNQNTAQKPQTQAQVQPQNQNKQNPSLAPANQNLIDKRNVQNNPFNNQTQKQPAQNDDTSKKAFEESVDTATYVPSSDFVAKPNTLSTEQSKEISDVMTRSDKLLKKAEEFI